MNKKTLAMKIIIVVGISVVGVLLGVYLKNSNRIVQETTNTDQQKDVVTDIADKETLEEKNSEEKNGYILPESNQRFIKYNEILDFDTETLKLAKNEIYARHGYIFQTESIAEYFEGCGWYSPSVEASKFDDSVFSQYEIKNIQLLEDYEKASGYSYPLKVKNKKTVKVDLDGDGRLEKISFRAKTVRESDDYSYTKYTITVNHSVIKYQDSYDEGRLCVVDINTDDKQKELCFENWEPNDYTGRVYLKYSPDDELTRIPFEDEYIVDENFPEEEEYKFAPTTPSYTVEYLGDGRMIHTAACEGITRLIVAYEYRLTKNGTIKPVDRVYRVGKDFNDFLDGDNDINVTLKKNLTMYGNHSKSSKKYTVKPQKLKIIALYISQDSEEGVWTKVELEDKSTKWVEPLRDQLNMEKIFDGIHFAS